MIKVRATENTYNAKEGLKENGFAWNSEDKVWEREFDSMEAYNEFMEHFLNPTYYGRKVVNRYHSVVVFEVEEIVIRDIGHSQCPFLIFILSLLPDSRLICRKFFSLLTCRIHQLISLANCICRLFFFPEVTVDHIL